LKSDTSTTNELEDRPARAGRELIERRSARHRVARRPQTWPPNTDRAPTRHHRNDATTDTTLHRQPHPVGELARRVVRTRSEHDRIHPLRLPRGQEAWPVTTQTPVAEKRRRDCQLPAAQPNRAVLVVAPQHRRHLILKVVVALQQVADRRVAAAE